MKESGTAARGVNWRVRLINPVLDKEIRLRMRSPRAMWTLFFYLLAIGLMAFAAIYLTQVLSGSGSSYNPEQSKILFYFLSFAQLGLVAFMAPGLTAGVISGEREKQTLNLLLTTQQSSSTIILSKLVSSLSFMVLIVVSTIPIYAMVFLYGGVSPKQMTLIFLFYLFIMLVLGSFGIFFSTILKKTMMSVISTYGVTLFIFVGTAILYFVMVNVLEDQYRYSTVSPSSTPYAWVGHIMAFNPAVALYSILEPSISDDAFLSSRYGGSGSGAPIALWLEFMIIYTVISSIALWLSVRNLRPRLNRKR
ncbi:ABC transporter permease [Paenibacillus nanensis]|uniref:ABC transporter permease n=1 Tax=Paenibacillus nanensis TaxID=393251 RepID=UPI001F0B96D8|nr:ABC transporter permease [Paenibacillus nanensis]